jgi:hypothetical protein
MVVAPVSRAERPVIARVDRRLLDAGIAPGLAHGWSIEASLRLGAAEGALNAIRGLASGTREESERLARHIAVRPLLDARREA